MKNLEQPIRDIGSTRARTGSLRGALLLAGAGALALAGCGPATPTVSAQDPVFAGLDAEVVAEVLESPVAADRVAGDDQSTAKARYQGMVRNVVACRSALQVYQEWMRTGVAPEFPAQPSPESPAAYAGDMDDDIAALQRMSAGGDISVLRQELTQDSGCGAWVPAEPGDIKGPTVRDVVRDGK